MEDDDDEEEVYNPALVTAVTFLVIVGWVISTLAVISWSIIKITAIIKIKGLPFSNAETHALYLAGGFSQAAAVVGYLVQVHYGIARKHSAQGALFSALFSVGCFMFYFLS